ncbi:MAG: DUF4147 domain-containing protein [Chloroflexi bacterium]|nr:MAG: DUF4147 domain-containing protein [Chloroflexota bacterium]
MKRILNPETLTSHGNIAGRKAVLEILEAGMQAADPYNNVFKLMRVEGHKLIVGYPAFEPPGGPQSGEEEIDLNQVGRIFVLGAGKGVQRTAKAIEEILGDRLTGGHVIDKHGGEKILQKIGVTFGAHPVPDEGCVQGSQQILEMTRDLRPDDLVFTIICNGVSSLLTLPAPGISLEDVRQTTYIFQIEKGGQTIDLTPIRNHLDQLKGGKLTAHIQPARAIHLIAFRRRTYKDLMHHRINRWLHTLPDYLTYADAVDSLKKWDAWDAVPASVREHLLRADPAQETLSLEDFNKTRFRIFCTMPDELGMLHAARQKAIELGFTPHVLYNNHVMQPEAGQIGKFVANLAIHSSASGDPFEPPCALFGRGEMVVTVGNKKGMGGRNQEYALRAALELAPTDNIVMGSVDSDGTDGPGKQFIDGYDDIPVLSGAIVDGSTVARARELGLNLYDELKEHNTSPPLYKLGDGVIAVPGIAMGDLSVTLVLGRGSYIPT